MRNKKSLPLLLVLLSLIAGTAFAQGDKKEGKVNTTQPTIMVIPFVKANEDLRTILEADVNRRIAVIKIQEAFDNRGFRTTPFLKKLDDALTNKIFTGENQDDIKSQLVEFSGADIFVEVEVPPMVSATSGNSARLILTAYDASSSLSLSNKVCESPRFNTSDYGALVSRAIGKNEFVDNKQPSCMDEFLNTMQSSFDGIVKEGRPVKINFVLAQGSKIKFSTEVKQDGLPLSDVIETWIADNALYNKYHLQGVTDLKLFFDEVRIPLKDERGRNFLPTHFALKIYQFMKGKGYNTSKQIKAGTIFITVN